MKTIFVIGNSPRSSEIFHLLQSYQIDRILRFNSGEEALSFTNQEQPDIIISELEAGAIPLVRSLNGASPRFYILADTFDRYRPEVLWAREEGLSFILLPYPVKEHKLNLILRMPRNEYCPAL